MNTGGMRVEIRADFRDDSLYKVKAAMCTREKVYSFFKPFLLLFDTELLSLPWIATFLR